MQHRKEKIAVRKLPDLASEHSLGKHTSTGVMMMPPDQSVTSVEVHGFVGWVASAVAFGGSPPAQIPGCGDMKPANDKLLACCAVVYLLWALVPDSVLRSYGVTYYPSK